MAVVGAAASGAGRGPRSDAFDAAVAAACATLSALIVRPLLAGLLTGRQVVLAGLLTVHGATTRSLSTRVTFPVAGFSSNKDPSAPK